MARITNQHPKKPATLAPQSHPKYLQWLERFVPYILIAAGTLGSFSSFMLAVEEIQHLKHPAAKLGCDLNPIIGCGANMNTWQGHVFFGVPNEFLGLVVFVVMITIGAGILAGAKFRRWFWVALQAGLFFGLIFVHWFIYESIFVLGHLCPYCMVTWVATITGFWYLTLYSIRAEHIRLHGKLARVNAFIQRHHADILVIWLLIIAAIILKHFWYYFGTL